MNSFTVELKRKEKNYIADRINGFRNHLILNQISEIAISRKSEIHHTLEMISQDLNWYEYLD